MKVKHYFASGKLYIAGEYAVVFRKSAAILAPLNLGIHAKISDSDTYGITTSKYAKEEFLFEVKNYMCYHLDLLFIKDAINTTFSYLKELNIKLTPFRLELKSTLDNHKNEKLGFGSSAAVTVACIGAILSYYDIPFSREEVYKLSVLSQIETYPYSSYGDIAASAMNEWIYYKPFSLSFLHKNLVKNIKTLIKMKWDDLEIHPFPVQELPMLVIWTKKEASSSMLVERVGRFSNQLAFLEFAKHTEETVEKLYSAFTNQNNLCIINDIQRLNLGLQELGQFTQEVLFTQEMEKIANILKEFECGYKFSGAGAGDCMIAFFRDANDAKEAAQRLTEENVTIIPNIARGVSNETQR